MRRFRRQGFLAICVICLTCGCASHERVNPVLEPAEAESEKPIQTRPANYEKLMGLLSNLGYEGVGLEYDDEKTIDLLIAIFSDPRAKGLKLRLVYTGLTMSFDVAQDSLTIGGVSNAQSALEFMRKHIPAAVAAPRPTPKEGTPVVPEPMAPPASDL